MSKALASEFSTWESLYWPENVPKTKTTEISPKTIVEGAISKSGIKTKEYKVEPSVLKGFVEGLLQSIDQSRSSETKDIIVLSTADPLGTLAGLLVSFSSGASLILSKDAASGTPVEESGGSGSITLNKVSSTGDPLKDFKLERAGINPEAESSSSTSAETLPSLTIVLQDQTRIIYSQSELAGSVESFNTFVGLPGNGSIAILGSMQTEFGLNAAVSSLASGASLLLADKLADLKDLPLDQLRSVFIGRDVINEAGGEEQLAEFGGSQLKPLRNSISSIIVDGPVSAKFTKNLERATHIPVLQVYGISGRGIILANPAEFNVHGSVGIPVTNVEAVIADNYEGNWMRDRILMGPAVEGEIIIRGSFIDLQRDSGDARQTPVKAQILGQSIDWLATGLTARMDENGFFYVNDPCFR